jgi:ApbE superfamily uncharacterized protein (UPF0280 family)
MGSVSQVLPQTPAKSVGYNYCAKYKYVCAGYKYLMGHSMSLGPETALTVSAQNASIDQSSRNVSFE